MESLVFDYLAGLGDIGVWVAAIGLWRLEKRITILEVKTAQ